MVFGHLVGRMDPDEALATVTVRSSGAVLLGGIWVDGFLLEWRRGADGRWKGLVNYRDRASRSVALKDQTELKPAEE